MSVLGLKSVLAEMRLAQFLNPLSERAFSVFLFLPLAKSMAGMLYYDQVVGIAPRKLNISRVPEAYG
ncbi:hypothetical protein PL8927_750058 [Planktothrix serta PCC 8927]|uniref:Uncharacterized protein n=1 Tax=Planktothrix serta PCC 8927 TaxID=671068 RepID=A0A7Z9BVW4_9CYAN|nr:hypothetical protein PL8927_750058 [Planktothrix serta PCC 8927]